MYNLWVMREMTSEEMITKLDIFSLDNKETTICTSMVFCGSS